MEKIGSSNNEDIEMPRLIWAYQLWNVWLLWEWWLWCAYIMSAPLKLNFVSYIRENQLGFIVFPGKGECRREWLLIICPYLVRYLAIKSIDGFDSILLTIWLLFLRSNMFSCTGERFWSMTRSVDKKSQFFIFLCYWNQMSVVEVSFIVERLMIMFKICSSTISLRL